MHCWEKIKRFLNCRYCLYRKLQLPGMRNQYFSTSITCSSTHVKVLRLVTTMACLWPTHGIQFARQCKNFVDNGNQINVAWFSHFLFCFINIHDYAFLSYLKYVLFCIIIFSGFYFQCKKKIDKFPLSSITFCYQSNIFNFVPCHRKHK